MTPTPATATLGSTAMVLAAGLGRRMGALTRVRPKPMVEVAGRPLIDHVLDRLAAAGFARAVVNVHYQADVLRRYLLDRARPEIVWSDETDRLLDTGGGIRRALHQFGANPFLAVNSDGIWMDGRHSAIDRLAARWDDAQMDVLLLLAETVAAIGYDGRGDFMMSDEGRLVRREEMRMAPFAFTGIQILHPRLFEGTREEPFSLNRLYDRAAAAGRLFGLLHDGAWMHVGTPEGVDLAERRLR
jgi:MurNAc alpha-1-phosphate uridylyltransferase